MSREASLFPIYFFDCDIYCKKCLQVKKFKIFSQETYDKSYGKSEIPPNKPLYCKCETCGEFEIYATNEFAELQEEPFDGLCKIWGMADLHAGDRVYHPEQKLCIVDYCSSSQIELINKNKEKIIFKIESIPQEQTALYRLFPDDFERAKIGDRIYNTQTEIAGYVVGLDFNGMQKIFVKLENGEIVKYDCENDPHYLTDELLEKNIKWRCKDLPYFKEMQICSRAKIIYMNCMIPDFSAACKLNDIASTIPQARSFVIRLTVPKTDITPNIIYKELLKNFINICCCEIKIDNEDVYISGFYSLKDTPEQIYRTLSKFPIKKINLKTKMRSDLKILKTINRSDRFIKISKIDKDIHIDGWVKTEKEKSKANLKAFFYNFSFRIENHLMVMG